MAVFNLVGGLGLKQVQETIGYNTDSVFDYMTGDVARTYDGKWGCRGGFGAAVSGIAARQGSYKSTFNASLAMRMCSIYQSEFTILDSEDAITRSKERILRLAGDHQGVLSEDDIISLDAKNQYDLESIRQLIYDIGEKKKAAGKDAMITTPFLDPKTSERIRIYRPTVIFIDSYSFCACTEEKNKVNDKGLDDGASKTYAMLDANKKTSVIQSLSRYASAYGMQILTSAHYGSKIAMDPYAPNPKAGQWMNSNDSPKKVGSMWGFLTSPMCRITSCTKIVDDNKMCKYRIDENSNALDLNEIVLIVDRCKNNASGVTHPFVVSQSDGLLTDVSDYHYLRQTGKGFSMTGNNVTHQPFLLSDVNLTRNTFRGMCRTDPRITRSLQLASELYYILTNWNVVSIPFMKFDPKEYNDVPKRILDVLNSDKNKMSVDRILSSRGYWLPDEIPSDKEYLSIIDVVEFMQNNKMLKS